MSWYIHHCGEYSNRAYCEIFETHLAGILENCIGPFQTKEEAIKAAERRGLTSTSLKEVNK